MTEEEQTVGGGAVPPSSQSYRVLAMNTLAFTVNFACWMMYGVLITFLVVNRVDTGLGGPTTWDKVQIGWLIGIPVLTGSILRLPIGVLTDMYGGRKVYTVQMLITAIPMYLVSTANTFQEFLLYGLGFGIAGTSFAVGIAYTSVWFTKRHQGTALGIFGAGNAGAALTAVFAPGLLLNLTSRGANLDGWRTLPKMYAALLVVMAVLFYVLTIERKVEASKGKSLRQRLEPLRNMRVWRFGLYYFLVFGGFVALSQWLIPYYVNVYTLSIATAGFYAALFSFPSGVIRALGGWMSDRWGAITVMYWVLGICLVASVLLVPPRMEIFSPGEGVTAMRDGTVVGVTDSTITVQDAAGISTTYAFAPGGPIVKGPHYEEEFIIVPKLRSWQEPVVKVGDQVKRRELLARGVSQIVFQANVLIFTILVFALGIAMGIGKAAVYKHIPDFFPNDVGVVGGIVGVLGGLGGFVCPVFFGYLLRWTGLWTTTWVFFAGLSLICLVWMHLVVRRMMQKEAPKLPQKI